MRAGGVSAVHRRHARDRGARLYYHSGADRRIDLDLAALESRISSEERQHLQISADDVTLTSQFHVTAVAKELFELAMELPGDQPAGSPDAWNLQSVLVNGKETGFEYRLAPSDLNKRLLKIELAQPIPAEGVADVAVVLRHAPPRKDLLWPAGAATASAPSDTLTFGVVHLRCNTTKGLLSVEPLGDIDVSADRAPALLKPISVGRMGEMGLPPSVQPRLDLHRLARSGHYQRPRHPAHRRPAAANRRRLSRPSGRPARQAHRRLAHHLYHHPRLHANALPPGRQIARTEHHHRALFVGAGSQRASCAPPVPCVRIISKTIVPFSDKTVPGSPELSSRYNLWQLALDGDTSGLVAIHVHYEIARGAGAKENAAAVAAAQPANANSAAPLVRPIGRNQFTVKDELLAIQASQELAVSQESTAMSEIDAIELPALPAPANRLLWALRLESPLTARGATAAVTLTTTAHDNYATPPALVLWAHYTTFLDRAAGDRASCRTEAAFQIVNSGLQFLSIDLPKDAQLWSIRIGDQQAKPKRGEGNQYLVSIPRTTEPLTVTVVYAGAASSRSGKLALEVATLEGLRVNQSHWTVYPPPGYRVQSGDQATRTGSAPAYAQVGRFLEDVMGGGALFCTLGMERHESASKTGAGGQASVPPVSFPDDENYREEERPSGATADEALSSHRYHATTTQPNSESVIISGTLSTGRTMALKPPVQMLDNSSSMGRYTLPVELVATPGGGGEMGFASLGQPRAAIRSGRNGSLAGRRFRVQTWWGIGFALAVLWGVPRARRRRAGGKTAFVIFLLMASTLAAIWCSAGEPRPAATALFNGIFYAALSLIPLYLAVGIIRHIIDRRHRPSSASATPSAATAAALKSGPSAAGPVATVLLAAAMLLATAVAMADPPPAQQAAQNDQRQATEARQLATQARKVYDNINANYQPHASEGDSNRIDWVDLNNHPQSNTKAELGQKLDAAYRDWQKADQEASQLETGRAVAG